MTGFYPPIPEANQRKLNPITRLLRGRYSAIDIVYDKSYDMKLGEVRTPHKRFYFANQPALVGQLLKDPDRFPKSDLMGALLDQLLGQSIFITNGELWRRQRRMMAPSFEHARIADSFDKMVEAADAMVGRLRPHADDSAFLIDPEMTHVTADIIFRTIYSRPMTRENAAIIFSAFSAYQELAYAHGFWTMAGLPQWLSISRPRARKYAHKIRDLLERYVADRLETPDDPDNRHADILQSLMEAQDPETGDHFSKAGLVDQVGIMFLAGHETSASALSWALYIISNVPAVAERMRREADAFWANNPSFTELRTLRFTRDVFRETLRLYPPVAMLPRDATQLEEMRGKQIARGSILFVSPWLIQRQRSTWNNPNMFDPDRFSDPSQAPAVRDSYLPFSKGPRVCLGASFALQEAVIILSAILHNFEPKPVEDHVPEPVARLTLRAINGIAIRLTPREKTGRQSSSEVVGA